jgi:hypothetical protein
MMTTKAPSVAFASQVAEYFLVPFRRTLGYADLLVKDIPAEKFARTPVPTLNHPAFNMGHLSLYPNRIFLMIGRPELVVERDGYSDLFKAGVACVEQDGRYPHKDEILEYFRERYAAVEAVLANTPDEVFQRENPLEGRMREIFPIVGVGVNFMLNNHMMSHLGQISAWRRVMGMGSVM